LLHQHLHPRNPSISAPEPLQRFLILLKGSRLNKSHHSNTLKMTDPTFFICRISISKSRNYIARSELHSKEITIRMPLMLFRGSLSSSQQQLSFRGIRAYPKLLQNLSLTHCKKAPKKLLSRGSISKITDNRGTLYRKRGSMMKYGEPTTRPLRLCTNPSQ